MNAISAVKMRRNLEFETPYTCLAALKEGSIETRVSAVVMGFGNIVHKQAVKGVLFLAAEIAYIAFMILYGFHNIYMLGSLGTVERQESLERGAAGVRVHRRATSPSCCCFTAWPPSF